MPRHATLTEAFRILGGVHRGVIFDNMNTAVDRIGPGKARQVNAQFAAMANHYLFEPEFGVKTKKMGILYGGR